MRVASLDELHRPLQRDVIRRHKKKVDMVRHQNESMQLETALSTISIESLQEQSGVRLHDEESSPLKCRESYEVSPRRRDQSCRFHRAGPQRLKAAISCQPNAVRLEVAPFPFRFSPDQSLIGTAPIIPSNGKGTTSSRAVYAPTLSTALTAGELFRLARFRLSCRPWVFCLRSARTGRARLRVVPFKLYA